MPRPSSLETAVRRNSEKAMSPLVDLPTENLGVSGSPTSRIRTRLPFSASFAVPVETYPKERPNYDTVQQRNRPGQRNATELQASTEIKETIPSQGD